MSRGILRTPSTAPRMTPIVRTTTVIGLLSEAMTSHMPAS